MSIKTARSLGRAFEGIDLLQLLGLLTDKEARNAMRRLGERARKNGLEVSITNHETGMRLFRQIRFSWVSGKGATVYMYFPGPKPRSILAEG